MTYSNIFSVRYVLLYFLALYLVYVAQPQTMFCVQQEKLTEKFVLKSQAIKQSRNSAKPSAERNFFYTVVLTLTLYE